MFELKAPIIWDFQLPCLITTVYYSTFSLVACSDISLSGLSWADRCQAAQSSRYDFGAEAQGESHRSRAQLARWLSDRALCRCGWNSDNCLVVWIISSFSIYWEINLLIYTEYSEIEDYHPNWKQFFGGIQTTNQAWPDPLPGAVSYSTKGWIDKNNDSSLATPKHGSGW